MGAGLAAAAALLILMRPWEGASQQASNGSDPGGAIAFEPTSPSQLTSRGAIDVLPAGAGAVADPFVLDQEGLLRPAGLRDERIAEQVWSTLGRQGFGMPEQDPLSNGQQNHAVSGSTGPFLLTPTTLPGLR